MCDHPQPVIECVGCTRWEFLKVAPLGTFFAIFWFPHLKIETLRHNIPYCGARNGKYNTINESEVRKHNLTNSNWSHKVREVIDYCKSHQKALFEEWLTLPNMCEWTKTSCNEYNTMQMSAHNPNTWKRVLSSTKKCFFMKWHPWAPFFKKIAHKRSKWDKETYC